MASFYGLFTLVENMFSFDLLLIKHNYSNLIYSNLIDKMFQYVLVGVSLVVDFHDSWNCYSCNIEPA